MNPKDPQAGQARVILVTKIVAAGLTGVMIWSLAYALPVSEFGRVALALNAAVLISVVTAMGQQMHLLRHVPGLGRGAATGVVVQAGKRAGAGLVVFGVLGGLAIPFLPQGAGMGYLLALVALALATALADFLAHAARALGAPFLALWPRELGWRALVALALVTAALPEGLTAVGAVAAMAAILLALGLVQARLVIGRIMALPAEPGSAHATVGSGDFWISSVAAVFLANADTLAVGLFLGPEAAAAYFLANRLALFLAFFVIAENMSLAPEIARRANLQGGNGLDGLCRASARRAAVQTCTAALVLVLLAEPVLSAFGDGYASASAPLIWLVLAAVVNAVSGPGDIVLNMAGSEAQARRIAVATLISGSVLMLAGAAVAGADGVGIAVLVTTLGRKAAAWALVRRLYGFRCDAFGGRTGIGTARWLS